MQRYESSDNYLSQSVQNASPARLRLMLIDRGLQLAQSLASIAHPVADEASYRNQSLRLRDILGELLSGVTATESDVAKQVSDLYVFLLQHLTQAETETSPDNWNDIAHVLEVEQGTWQEVCAQAMQGTPGFPAQTVFPSSAPPSSPPTASAPSPHLRDQAKRPTLNFEA